MEASTRPGNRERGWNDPPMFVYNAEAQAQKSPRKNLLNQRVGMPQSYPSPLTQAQSPNSTPQGPPPAPLSNYRPGLAPVDVAPPPTTGDSSGSPTRAITESDKPGGSLQNAVDDPAEVTCEATLAKFRNVFEQCQSQLQKRVITDIERRLKTLTDFWKSDKLSPPVQSRTAQLASELLNRKYDRAHELHLSLMVDHVSEVSQWMVGVKRLIHEARTILPFVEDAETEQKEMAPSEPEESRTETGGGDADSDVLKPQSIQSDVTTDTRTEPNEDSITEGVEQVNLDEK